MQYKTYFAVLPAQSESTVVRYRIKAVLTGGVEVTSPRRTDPYEWYAYFVNPSKPEVTSF
jgi:hypothetical protein